MTLVDGVVGAYCAWAAWHGARRGLPEESYRLLRLVVSLAAGCGLFTLVNKIVAVVMSFGGDAPGGLGFVGGMAVAFVAMRKLRASLVAAVQRWADAKIIRPGGAVLGAVKAFTGVAALISFLQLSPLVPAGHRLAAHSVTGRIVAVFLPQDDSSRDQPEAPMSPD